MDDSSVYMTVNCGHDHQLPQPLHSHTWKFEGRFKAGCVEKLPRVSVHHIFGSALPLALSEIVDPGPFYGVDFSVATTPRAALEFFNPIGWGQTFEIDTLNFRGLLNRSLGEQDFKRQLDLPYRQFVEAIVV